MFGWKGWKNDVLETILAFVLAVVFYMTLSLALSTSVPIVSVVSQSMEPVLHRGDLLLVVGQDDYDIGDVAVYFDPIRKIDIIHRIIEKRENGFVFKGDNNPIPDSSLVDLSQIKGRAVFAVPLVGYPRLALQLVGI